MLHAKNGTVRLDGTDMDYIRFGTGEKNLVMLPGLGDGLRSMKRAALPFAMAYRAYAREYTVYAFSRKAALPEGCTTREGGPGSKTRHGRAGQKIIAPPGDEYLCTKRNNP